MESLLAAGAQIVGGCCGSTPEHIRELAQTVENTYRELAPQEPDHFAAAIESESFFLGDDISLSEPLECSYDLGDDLIDIEDEQVNAALVEVNSIDDAKLLIENASMTRLPIVVRIHNLDVLEYTLRNFQGRLIVDSACDLEEEEMSLSSIITGRGFCILSKYCSHVSEPLINKNNQRSSRLKITGCSF